MQWHKSFVEALENRISKGIYRSLKHYNSDQIDFFSNDYLGFSRNEKLHTELANWFVENPHELSGSTGSRLISGNKIEVENIEKSIAKWHGYDNALFFTSGYNANLALFSSLGKRGDTVIVDELIHRSVHDGIRLSFAEKKKFKHNDLSHLESQLQKAKGKTIVAVESLYSMDGDFAPLREIIDLTQKYEAELIVDEAHAFGVFGFGLVHQLGLQNDVWATVITYGKAMGMHGAVVLGDEILKNYLINFASPFIYSTSPPISQIRSIQFGYEFLKNNSHLIDNLQNNIQYLRQFSMPWFSEDKSPIQILEFNNSNILKEAYNQLLKENILTYAVFPPTVKEGSERLRICVHAFNSQQEIQQLTDILKPYF